LSTNFFNLHRNPWVSSIYRLVHAKENHHLLGLLGQSRLRFTPSDLVTAWRIHTMIPALVPELPQQLRRDSSFCQKLTLICTQMSRAKSPYASTYGYSYAGLAFLPHSVPHSRLSGYEHGLLSLRMSSVLRGTFAPKLLALVPELPQQLGRGRSFCQEPTPAQTQMSRAKSPYTSANSLKTFYFLTPFHL
jgi:hypothetical protein